LNREPRGANAYRHFAEALAMIIETTAVIFLIKGVSIVSRLLARRRDVFYYVSKPSRAVSFF
jgi:hypothetical protein